MRSSTILAACLAILPAVAQGQGPTHPDGNILRTIPLPGLTYGVTIDASDQVFVSEVGDDRVVRFAFNDSASGASIEIGAEPPHIAVEPDGGSIFAVLQSGRAVIRVDARSGRAVDSISLGGDGFNLALDPDGAHLVATAAHGWAYRLSRRPLRITDSLFVGASPNGVTYDRDGKMLYISSRDAGTVTQISAEKFKALRTWSPGGPLQRVALTPDGRTLFAAREGSAGAVIKIDTRSDRFEIVPLGGDPYGIGVTPDGRRLWVLQLEGATIAVLDVPSLRLVKSVEVGGRPRNIAFTRRGDGAAITTETSVVLLK